LKLFSNKTLPLLTPEEQLKNSPISPVMKSRNLASPDFGSNKNSSSSHKLWNNKNQKRSSTLGAKYFEKSNLKMVRSYVIAQQKSEE
jgi:hypothetical protein